METRSVLEIRDLKKKYKGFALDIPDLSVPQGFATALIGENGAGKSTLLEILSGIRLDYTGSIRYFETYSDKEKEKLTCPVKEMIGFQGNHNYFLPHWTVQQTADITGLLFDHFSIETWEELLKTWNYDQDTSSLEKEISDLSDGNLMKVVLASVFARDTKLLLLDEPASPLDPLMRSELCTAIREYLSGDEQRSVLFSTHNISDMEDVTDYCIIMADGRVLEQGFVTDLKQKYIYIKGEPTEAQKAKAILYTMDESKMGYEGICLSENLDRLAGLSVLTEEPSLNQISVAVMKHAILDRRG